MYPENYEIYVKSDTHYFFGDYSDYVVVNRMTGTAIGHLRAWDNPEVQDERNPRKAGVAGKRWATNRPKGFRKMAAGMTRERALEWALEVIADY